MLDENLKILTDLFFFSVGKGTKKETKIRVFIWQEYILRRLSIGLFDEVSPPKLFKHLNYRTPQRTNITNWKCNPYKLKIKILFKKTIGTYKLCRNWVFCFDVLD